MFRLKLILRQKNDEIMIFSPAPWFRILFLLLAAIVISGIITIAAEDDEGPFIVPVIIAVACIVAALYEESWTFDRGKGVVTEQTGLIFVHSTKVFSFAEIESLELSVFLRGAESDKKVSDRNKFMDPFSKENTEELSGNSTKIIHKRYHQEIKLNLKNGTSTVIEILDTRNPDALATKAEVLSEFSGIRLER